MKVTKEKAAQNRQAMLDAASRLYRERGIDGIGIGELARSVGLTHGGFYGQFPGGKEQFAAEAVIQTFAEKIQRWRAATSIGEVVREYLSPEHLSNWIEGCPMPTLSVDVARNGGAVSEAFTVGARELLEALTKLADGASEQEKHTKAAQIAASLVGTVMLARAVDDPALARHLLDSTIQAWT